MAKMALKTQGFPYVDSSTKWAIVTIESSPQQYPRPFREEWMKPAPSAEAEWVRFASDLALCLGDLDEDEFLIVSAKRANYYVQFASQGKFGLRAEAACNTYILPLDAVLTVEDYELMAQLGWNRATNHPPEESVESDPPDGSPNFFVDFPSPIDFTAVATLATASLRKVYRIGHPGDLKYEAFASNDTQIRFPTLRIKRHIK